MYSKLPRLTALLQIKKSGLKSDRSTTATDEEWLLPGERNEQVTATRRKQVWVSGGQQLCPDFPGKSASCGEVLLLLPKEDGMMSTLCTKMGIVDEETSTKMNQEKRKHVEKDTKAKKVEQHKIKEKQCKIKDKHVTFKDPDVDNDDDEAESNSDERCFKSKIPLKSSLSKNENQETNNVCSTDKKNFKHDLFGYPGTLNRIGSNEYRSIIQNKKDTYENNPIPEKFILEKNMASSIKNYLVSEDNIKEEIKMPVMDSQAPCHWEENNVDSQLLNYSGELHQCGHLMNQHKLQEKSGNWTGLQHHLKEMHSIIEHVPSKDLNKDNLGSHVIDLHGEEEECKNHFSNPMKVSLQPQGENCVKCDTLLGDPVNLDPHRYNADQTMNYSINLCERNFRKGNVFLNKSTKVDQHLTCQCKKNNNKAHNYRDSEKANPQSEPLSLDAENTGKGCALFKYLEQTDPQTNHMHEKRSKAKILEPSENTELPTRLWSQHNDKSTEFGKCSEEIDPQSHCVSQSRKGCEKGSSMKNNVHIADIKADEKTIVEDKDHNKDLVNVDPLMHSNYSHENQHFLNKCMNQVYLMGGESNIFVKPVKIDQTQLYFTGKNEQNVSQQKCLECVYKSEYENGSVSEDPIVHPQTGLTNHKRWSFESKGNVDSQMCLTDLHHLNKNESKSLLKQTAEVTSQLCLTGSFEGGCDSSRKTHLKRGLAKVEVKNTEEKSSLEDPRKFYLQPFLTGETQENLGKSSTVQENLEISDSKTASAHLFKNKIRDNILFCDLEEVSRSLHLACKLEINCKKADTCHQNNFQTHFVDSSANGSQTFSRGLQENTFQERDTVRTPLCTDSSINEKGSPMAVTNFNRNTPSKVEMKKNFNYPEIRQGQSLMDHQAQPSKEILPSTNQKQKDYQADQNTSLRESGDGDATKLCVQYQTVMVSEPKSDNYHSQEEIQNLKNELNSEKDLSFREEKLPRVKHENQFKDELQIDEESLKVQHTREPVPNHQERQEQLPTLYSFNFQPNRDARDTHRPIIDQKNFKNISNLKKEAHIGDLWASPRLKNMQLKIDSWLQRENSARIKTECSMVKLLPPKETGEQPKIDSRLKGEKSPWVKKEFALVTLSKDKEPKSPTMKESPKAKLQLNKPKLPRPKENKTGESRKPPDITSVLKVHHKSQRMKEQPKVELEQEELPTEKQYISPMMKQQPKVKLEKEQSLLIKKQSKSLRMEEPKSPNVKDQSKSPRMKQCISPTMKQQFKSPKMKTQSNSQMMEQCISLRMKEQPKSPRIKEQIISPRIKEQPKSSMKEQCISSRVKEQPISPRIKEQCISPRMKEQSKSPIKEQYISPRMKPSYLSTRMEQCIPSRIKEQPISPRMNEQSKSPIKEQYISPRMKEPSYLSTKTEQCIPLRIKEQPISPRMKEQRISPRMKEPSYLSTRMEQCIPSRMKEQSTLTIIKEQSISPRMKEQCISPKMKEPSRLSTRIKGHCISPRMKEPSYLSTRTEQCIPSRIKEQPISPRIKEQCISPRMNEQSKLPIKEQCISARMKEPSYLSTRTEQCIPSRMKEQPISPRMKEQRISPRMKEPSYLSTRTEQCIPSRIKEQPISPRIKEQCISPRMNEQSKLPIKEQCISARMKEPSYLSTRMEQCIPSRMKEQPISPRMKEQRISPRMKEPSYLSTRTEQCIPSRIKEQPISPRIKEQCISPRMNEQSKLPIKEQCISARMKEPSYLSTRTEQCIPSRMKEQPISPRMKEQYISPRMKEPSYLSTRTRIKEQPISPRMKEQRISPRMKEPSYLSTRMEQRIPSRMKEQSTLTIIKEQSISPRMKEQCISPKMKEPSRLSTRIKGHCISPRMKEQPKSTMKEQPISPRMKEQSKSPIKEQWILPRMKELFKSPRMKEQPISERMKEQCISAKMKQCISPRMKEQPKSTMKEQPISPRIKEQSKSPIKQQCISPKMKEQWILPRMKELFKSPRMKQQILPWMKEQPISERMKEQCISAKMKKQCISPKMKEPSCLTRMKQQCISPRMKQQSKLTMIKEQYISPRMKEQWILPRMKEHPVSARMKELSKVPSLKQRILPRMEEQPISPRMKEQWILPRVKEQFKSPMMKEQPKSPRMKQQWILLWMKEQSISPRMKEQSKLTMMEEQCILPKMKEQSKSPMKEQCISARMEQHSKSPMREQCISARMEQWILPRMKQHPVSARMEELSKGPRLKQQCLSTKLKEQPEVKHEEGKSPRIKINQLNKELQLHKEKLEIIDSLNVKSKLKLIHKMQDNVNPTLKSKISIREENNECKVLSSKTHISNINKEPHVTYPQLNQKTSRVNYGTQHVVYSNLDTQRKFPNLTKPQMVHSTQKNKIWNIVGASSNNVKNVCKKQLFPNERLLSCLSGKFLLNDRSMVGTHPEQTLELKNDKQLVCSSQKHKTNKILILNRDFIKKLNMERESGQNGFYENNYNSYGSIVGVKQQAHQKSLANLEKQQMPVYICQSKDGGVPMAKEKSTENECYKKTQSYLTEMHKNESNVLLYVDNFIYESHSKILSAYSSFFERMLPRQDEDKWPFHIKLFNIFPEGIQVFLDYAYSGVAGITSSNVGEVLCTTILLDCFLLQQSCLKYKGSIQVDQALIILMCPKLPQNSDLITQAKCSIATHFFESQTKPLFWGLAIDKICEILSNNCLKTGSELNVFITGMKWLMYDFPNRRQYIERLLECIRFPLMTDVELIKVMELSEAIGILDVDSLRQKVIEACWCRGLKSHHCEDPLQISIPPPRQPIRC